MNTLSATMIRGEMQDDVPDVRLDTSLLASFSAGINSNVDGLMRTSFLGVEILDESRVSVEV